MAINPYTLQSLYEQGILDYVPYDLMNGPAISPVMSNGMNPYLQMAAQGGLYQNYGNQHDSFTHSNPQYPVYGPTSGYNNSQIGFQSNAGVINAYTQPNIGTQKRSVLNMFGTSGSGMYNNSSPFGTTRSDIGSMSNASPYGGFEDVIGNVSNGVGQTASYVSNAPKFIKNIAAAGIGLLGIMYLFKRGKKPKTSGNTSFWSKLNPMNWSIFKKK